MILHGGHGSQLSDKTGTDFIMCTEPQKLDNFWGFFMTKLSKQKKIELYQEWKIKGMPLLVIARRENLNRTALGYAIKLIDRYGPAILDAPHQTYTKEFKEKAIKQALFGTKSIVQLSLDLGLKSSGMLNNWLREYKENGYNVVIKQKGRPAYEQEGRTIAPAAVAEDSSVRRRKLAIAYRQCLYKKLTALEQKPPKK